MTNSKLTAADGDDLGLVASVGQAFGLSIAEAPVVCDTVGDLFSLVKARFERETASACATAISFYRLRKALVAAGLRPRLRPSDSLRLLAAPRPRAFLRDVASRTGMRTPKATVGWRGGLALILGALCAPSAILMALNAVEPALAWPVAGLAGAIWLWRQDAGAIPLDLQTLGDLARRMAWLNLSTLTADGAQVSDEDLWRALAQIVAEEAGVDPQTMTPETRLTPAT